MALVSQIFNSFQDYLNNEQELREVSRYQSNLLNFSSTQQINLPGNSWSC